MALQTTTPPIAPTAQFVGNAFVEQYYHILHHSPELVYRFYQDSSMLSRPDSNGVMTSVTSMQGINEKILSFDYKDYKAEIMTADAQKSYKEGVTVLVTGCLTGKDNLKRKFAQSFFLAPQDNGYFVLNDVFRYVEDGELLENHPFNGVDDTTAASLTADPEPTHLPDPPAPDPATAHMNADKNVVEETYDASEHETELVNEKEPVAEHPSHSYGNDVSVEVESASTTALEDAPKKSYASIVKVAKGSPGTSTTKVYVPTNSVNVSSKKTDKRSVESAAPVSVPEASPPSSAGTPESGNTNEEVEEGHSIYVRNLPFNVTVPQLEVEFNKFGPIKHEGIQVRNNKQQGYCFGFVEFQSLSSMNNAIQASPINIGGRAAVVEIKRTTTRVGSGIRGRFPSGRGGFRSDSFRVRGNYGGGGRSFGRNEHVSSFGRNEFVSSFGRNEYVSSFGRNEYVSRGEFSGRGRGPGGRGGDGYQQGRGRGGRGSGQKHNAVAA